MKAIILAAGTGSRLAPIGITTPKLLVPILNKTILEHQVEAVTDLVDEVIVVVGPNDFGQMINDYIAAKTWPMPISTVIQDQPLGTAHAVQAAADKAKDADRLLILLGDDLCSSVDLKMLASYPMAILGKQVNDWEKWGILQADEQGKLVKIIEKPEHFVGDIASTGIAILSPRIFELYAYLQPSIRGELEFPDSMSLLASEQTIHVCSIKDYWIPVGYPWHILDAQEQLYTTVEDNFDHELYPHVAKSGVVSIGKNVTIGEGVTLDNVVIGDDVVISDHCQLSGKSVIGSNIKLDWGVSIHGGTVFNGAHIGQSSIVNNSVIGYDVTFGKEVYTISIPSEDGLTVMSTIKGKPVDSQRSRLGVVIGDRAVISNRLLIGSGVKIWPGVRMAANEGAINDRVIVSEDIDS